MTLQQTIMMKLYGEDVWTGFRPGEPDPQGWHGDNPALTWLTGTLGLGLVVDVGVWKGQSTINMARAIKAAGLDGCVIAVDTFLGSPEHWEKGYFRRQHGLPDIYWTFLTNVHAAGVADYVVPLPQNSIAAAAILKEREITPTLVHVDAGHAYEEVIRDAEAYYGILANGGSLVGDDYHETWPDVMRAAHDFAALHALTLRIYGPKWIVQKTRSNFGGLQRVVRNLLRQPPRIERVA
jgi:hypothetical protein